MAIRYPKSADSTLFLNDSRQMIQLCLVTGTVFLVGTTAAEPDDPVPPPSELDEVQLFIDELLSPTLRLR